MNMKTLKYIVTSLLLVSAAILPLMAQDNGGVVRRRTPGGRDADKDATGMTQRMKSFYEEDEPSDANIEWMRVIYRSIDLTDVTNMALYYPELPNEDGQNLFFIIMRLLADGKIPAYEYLDGRELFTDQYRIKVSDMLDRFHVLYTEAKGSTERNPRYTIEESDIPSNEVLSYYIIEKMEFDRLEGKMKKNVLAICPVLHRTDEFGGDAIRYPMFWVKMSDIRPYIAQQYVFTDNDNNLARYNLEDFFIMGMYKGSIYKTKNLRNLSMVQMFPDPEDLKHAQDSIENRLESFDRNLWIPSREELQARAEAREAAADSIAAAEAGNDEEIVIRDRDEDKEKEKKEAKNKRSSRNKPKKSNVKQAKISNSGSAVRSVRRRK